MGAENESHAYPSGPHDLDLRSLGLNHQTSGPIWMSAMQNNILANRTIMVAENITDGSFSQVREVVMLAKVG